MMVVAMLIVLLTMLAILLCNNGKGLINFRLILLKISVLSWFCSYSMKVVGIIAVLCLIYSVEGFVFQKFHSIAPKSHIETLQPIPPLKTVRGQSWLQNTQIPVDVSSREVNADE